MEVGAGLSDFMRETGFGGCPLTAAKLNLKLWHIDFIGVYLNSLTKEDIYMKQLEGFIELGYKDYMCKLVHTIYGMMQGAHDWYKTLSKTYSNLGYTNS